MGSKTQKMNLLGALISFLLLISCSGAGSFEKMVEEGNYTKAINLYNDKINGNSKEESESMKFLIDYASESVKQYAAGDIDNIEVEANLKSVYEIDAALGIITGTLEDIKNSYEVIKYSKEQFSSGLTLLNTQEFDQAIHYFSMVDESDVENYDNAQESIESARQKLKEFVINTSNELIARSEYDKAIDVALEAEQYMIGSYDADLEEMISTAYTAKYETYISDYIERNDIASAILAFDEFQNNPYFKISPDLITMMESNKSIYRDQIIDRSIGKYYETGYEDAVSIISEGLSVLYDDNKLTDMLNLYYSSVPVELQTLPLIDSSEDNLNDKAIVSNFSFSDIDGNIYHNYFRLHDHGGNKEFRTFNLNGEYTNFSGTYFTTSNINPDHWITFEILADDIKIYESSKLQRNTPAVNFDINITNVKKLTIQGFTPYSTSVYGEAPSVVIAEATVYKLLNNTDLEVVKNK